MEIQKSCAENYTFYNEDEKKLMRGGFGLSSVIETIQTNEYFDRYNHLSVPIPLVLGGGPDYEDTDYDVKECVEEEDGYPVINKEIYDSLLFNNFPVSGGEKRNKNLSQKNLKISLRKTMKNQ
tara:strand:- start:4423 stop:4791 length:369 start_codon:yes stop_codon:yes gene_type:complete